MKPKEYAKKRLKLMWSHTLNPKKGLPFVRRRFLTKAEMYVIDRQYRYESKKLDSEMFGPIIDRLFG